MSTYDLDHLEKRLASYLAVRHTESNAQSVDAPRTTEPLTLGDLRQALELVRDTQAKPSDTGVRPPEFPADMKGLEMTATAMPVGGGLYDVVLAQRYVVDATGRFSAVQRVLEVLG